MVKTTKGFMKPFQRGVLASGVELRAKYLGC